MKVLIGCEESQVVCKAFRDAGFDALSCDIKPTRGNPDHHLQMDVMQAVTMRQWGLIILHPDCTTMAVSGNRHYAKGTSGYHKRIATVKWTMELWELALNHSKKVALENPSSVIFTELRKRGVEIQYVQPWMFGHPETKKTGFALHGLPRLQETDNVRTYMESLPEKEKHKIWYASPGKNRKRDRSKTFQGIADAIVNQWGNKI